MADLTGSTISTTYNLLLTTESAVMGSGLQSIQSGTGVSSALKLSTTDVSVNGSLGVGLSGTDTPDRTLHVDSGSTDTVALFQSSADANAYINIEDANTVTAPQIGAVTDALVLRTSNTPAITIDSSQNVGIGGTPSLGVLDVAADDAATAIAISEKGTGNKRFALMPLASGGWTTYATTEDGGSFVAGITQLGGNVGIGATDPAAEVEARGSLFLTTNSTTADEGQSVYFQTTTTGWNTAQAHGAISGKRTDGSNGYLTFSTRGSDTVAERMRIDSGGQATFTRTDRNGSNIKLELADDGALTGPLLTFYRNSASPADDDDLGKINFSGNNDADTEASFAYIECQAKDVSDGSQDGDLIFGTVANGSGDERMRIDSAGNVGIGGTPTQGKLHAFGNICIDSTAGASDILYSQTAAILSRHRTTNAVIIQSAGGDVSLRDSGGTDRLIVDNATGSVGIGTDSPSAELEILQSAGNAPELKITSGTVYTKIISDDASGFSAIDYSHDLRFKDAGTETMRIDSSGNVGIGDTPASGARLDVTGESGEFASYIVGANVADNSEGLRVQAGTSASDTAFEVIGRSLGTSYLSVRGDGNVGIGGTPNTGWNTNYTALQVGGTGSVYASTTAGAGANVFISQNSYLGTDGTSKHILTDEASDIYLSSGAHYFRVAASGTTNTTITWTTVIQTKSDGNVLLPNVPTSSDGSGLDAGTVYKDSSGFLKIA